MSTVSQYGLYPGMQETFVRLIRAGDAAEFTRLLAEDPVEGALAAPFAADSAGANALLLVGMIGRLLHTRIPGYGSQCITMQFEFLSPVNSGDQIETIIRLSDFDHSKHLATFRTDCYNQDKKQVITGQAVMLVPVSL